MRDYSKKFKKPVKIKNLLAITYIIIKVIKHFKYWLYFLEMTANTPNSL